MSSPQKKSEKKALWMTLGALVLAIALGFLLKFAFPRISDSGHGHLLFHAGKNHVPECFENGGRPRRIFLYRLLYLQFQQSGGVRQDRRKSYGYVLSLPTFIAIGVGLGIFFLFQGPGSPSMLDSAQAAAASVETTSVSMLDTVINIVPDNFVLPFLNADMLQIIFNRPPVRHCRGHDRGLFQASERLFRSLQHSVSEDYYFDYQIRTSGRILLRDLFDPADRHRYAPVPAGTYGHRHCRNGLHDCCLLPPDPVNRRSRSSRIRFLSVCLYCWYRSVCRWKRSAFLWALIRFCPCSVPPPTLPETPPSPWPWPKQRDCWI